MTNEDLVEIYKESYNVSSMLKDDRVKFGRSKIVRILKEAGVYEGLNGPNYLKHKVENHRKVMQEKYGVDNISQIKKPKLIKDNDIEYTKLNFDDELREYVKRVRNYTKNIVTRKKIVDLPDECYYTGFKFADVDNSNVNPNDPFKRTVDHKHPIILCFFEGWSIEEAGGESNLIFVTKYINSVKANTTHECFLPIAKMIKERIDLANV